eukprot:5594662-Amphidinium_carterae.1
MASWMQQGIRAPWLGQVLGDLFLPPHGGTLCMSALVGPGACAIADFCDDDGRQAGPSDTDSWAYVSAARE